MTQDNSSSILIASQQLIAELEQLAQFFEMETIFHIYLRTQVVHQLFQKTQELDPQRLALHHVQFTDPILALLKKIRAANEKNHVMLLDEVAFNEQLIEGFKKELEGEESFAAAVQRQSAIINSALFRLYENLSDLSREVPFPDDVVAFSNKWAGARFHAVPKEQMANLTRFVPDEAFKNSYGAIDKKLLGWQCKAGFRNHFVFGLKDGQDALEIYKMDDRDTWFSFYPRRRFFNDFDPALVGLDGIGTDENAKAAMVQELAAKNLRLRAGEQSIRKKISPEVAVLLTEYLDRLSAMDFLDLRDYEIQANILKAMLNTEGL